MSGFEWLVAFGLFLGGVARGWIGGAPSSVKRDKLAPKDSEAERNREARKRVR